TAAAERAAKEAAEAGMYFNRLFLFCFICIKSHQRRVNFN
ncbi:unnamed protein product, partial [Rotaria magnacalcarata]